MRELRRAMIDALYADGWSAAEIAGYVSAMHRAGWLRQSTPQWVRDAAIIHYVLPPATGFDRPRLRIARPLFDGILRDDIDYDPDHDSHDDSNYLDPWQDRDFGSFIG